MGRGIALALAEADPSLAIAVGTPQRVAQMPDVPTVAEMGYEDFETSPWYGVLVPAGAPPALVKRLQEESATALRSPVVTECVAGDGAVARGGPPSEFAAFIAREQATWSDIVKRAPPLGLTRRPSGGGRRSLRARLWMTASWPIRTKRARLCSRARGSA